MIACKSLSGISPSTKGFAISKAMSRNEGSGVLFMKLDGNLGNEVGMYKPPVFSFMPLITAVLRSVFTDLSRVSV